MITLTRTIKDNYTHTVKFHVRKEAIIGLYSINRQATILLVSGTEIEVHETKEEVLKLLE